MPNLQGASLVGRGEGGRSYAARTMGESGARSGREHSRTAERQGTGQSSMACGTLRV